MRLTTIGAIGIGYVLGARAGRKRYDQIRAMAQAAAQRLEAYGADGSLAARVVDDRPDAAPSGPGG